MLDLLADLAGIGDLREARALPLVGGLHATMRHAAAGVVEEPEEVTSADVVGPAPGRVVAHRRHHQRTDIEDGTAGLYLVGLITDRLAPRAHRRLVPELIRAPADKAELRVGGGRHTTPVGKREREFHVDRRLRREPQLRETMKPGALVGVVAGPAVPIFGELHRDAEGMAFCVTKDRRHPRDRLAETATKAGGGLLEEEPDSGLAIGWVLEGESHPLDGVVAVVAQGRPVIGRLLDRLRHSRQDRRYRVKIDPLPATDIIPSHRQRIAGRFACAVKGHGDD